MNSDDQQKKPGPGYETHDLNIRLIAILAFGALILLAITLYVLNQIFIVSKEKVIENTVLIPESAQLRELRNHEDEMLNSYKVVDSQTGIYQIPIKRAMEILADQASQNNARPQGNRKAP